MMKVIRWLLGLLGLGSGESQATAARSLDFEIKVRSKSLATYEWGCAYGYPVNPEIAVPLIVVSGLYSSPKSSEK